MIIVSSAKLKFYSPSCSNIWIDHVGVFVDKKKPDRYEIVGPMVAVLRAVIIFYAPG
jgi:drug/metabolite transporter superfamily protein YnfA